MNKIKTQVKNDLRADSGQRRSELTKRKQKQLNTQKNAYVSRKRAHVFYLFSLITTLDHLDEKLISFRFGVEANTGQMCPELGKR